MNKTEKNLVLVKGKDSVVRIFSKYGSHLIRELPKTFIMERKDISKNTLQRISEKMQNIKHPFFENVIGIISEKIFINTKSKDTLEAPFGSESIIQILSPLGPKFLPTYLTIIVIVKKCEWIDDQGNRLYEECAVTVYDVTDESKKLIHELLKK